MIVLGRGDQIERMFKRNRSIVFIAKTMGIARVHVIEHLARRGLYVRKSLKSKDQRAALAMLRYVSGNRALGSAFKPGTLRASKRKERRKVRTTMIVWRGFTRETEVECNVLDCGAGAGQIVCIECEGSCVGGYDQDEPCVDCKGSGKVFVSI